METPAGLWLPDDLIGAQASEDAPDKRAMDEWRSRLHEIDPGLMLVYTKANAIDLTPNRWYLIRRNEQGRNAYFEINDGNGNYSPFTERHFERLQSMDTHRHPRIWERWRAAQAEKSAAAQARKAAKGEEFRSKLEERLKHEFDVVIPVTGRSKELVDGKL